MDKRICKYCKQEFDISNKSRGWMANHVRWCDMNPKREDYVLKLENTRNNITDNSRKIHAEKIKNAHKDGRYIKAAEKGIKTKIKNGTLKHTDEAKAKISEAARASKHRRLRKGMVKYKDTMLDSSWELALAKRLDLLSIEWVRPKPLIWFDKDGKNHNYFPDFYLPKYDVYLDPKNPAAINAQKEKLNQLLEQYDNIIIIPTLEECNNFIAPLAQ